MKIQTVFLLLLSIILLPAFLIAQTKSSKYDILKKLGPHPLKIVDSIQINNEQFSKINANDIAVLTILTDTDATNKYGADAKDGAVVCETKLFARKHYTAFLRSKSKPYDSLYRIAGNDSTFQYIVNDLPKFYNYEGALVVITNETFISLDIITADELKNKYDISNKKYGILVRYRKE